MTDSITLNLRKRDKAITALRDAYATAKLIGATYAELLDMVAKARMRIMRCPLWVKNYFDGYDKALSDKLYETELVFGGFCKGRWFSVHSKRPKDYYGAFDISPMEWSENATERGHYWAPESRHHGKGQDVAKPFYVPADYTSAKPAA